MKNQPANAVDKVRSLGLEDLLEEEMTTHSSILAGKNPMAGCSPWGRKEPDI